MSQTDLKTPLRIVLVDDDDAVRVSIADFLVARGHAVTQISNGQEALGYLSESPFDIVITDIKMPGADGFEVLRYVQKNVSGVEVIMMTGFGDIDMAVNAMRDGAFDFFTKPVKMQDLHASIQRTERFHLLRKERDNAQSQLNQIQEEARQRHGLVSLIGQSEAIQEVKSLVSQIAQTDATTVLLTGETGTGKEVIARAIHHESSRTSGPFIPVDCTAIPDNLFESTFYGHEKGAFTDAQDTRRGLFEQADGGTLFLDEIGDMPAEMQVRLLRTLEERCIRRVGGDREIPVDVRVVSATNQNLTEAIAEGRFRTELYHRLNTFIIHLPPLRERPGDIQLLARHFLKRYARELNKAIEDFDPGALNRLQAYPFPGNVRELKNTLERAAILCQSDCIEQSHLLFTDEPRSQSEPQAPAQPSSLSNLLQPLTDDQLNLENVEAEVIREALRRCENNRGQAADLLGVSRFALRRRMALYEIE